LHPHDQRHLLEVHCKAQSAGLTDEVITAGLLHDIGKVTLTGARISLPARIAHVLLGRLAPQLRGSPTLARVPWLGVGLRLAERHAQYGAERLRALGVNESICRIVETHDLPNQNNPEMRALQAIDSATP
jgi:putative nucleotidyltransferase with HDIG domain